MPFSEAPKIPPQAIEAEESVLASCLMGNFHEAVDTLKAADFYRTANGIIFDAVAALADKKKPVDLVSVVDFLRSSGNLEQCGGSSFVARLINEIPVSASIENHCHIIKSKAILRSLIQKSQQIISNCYDGCDVEQVLDEAQSSMIGINLDGDTAECEHISSVVGDCIESIDRRCKNRDPITGIPTGIKRLDIMTSGLQLSDLVILAARPSMGKTALGLQIAKNAAENGYPTLIISLEMSRVQLGKRLISSTARIDHARVRSGYLSREQWDSIADASAKVAELPVHIDDGAALTNGLLRRKVRKYCHKHKIKLLVLDYLQLMDIKAENGRIDRAIGDITRTVKQMSKEFGICSLVLSQLNRKLEERSNKRPMLADLRESGAIEQDADVVLFIYRDEVYNKDENNPNRGMAEIIIAKQREGPTGFIPTTFIKEYMRFENPA